MWKGTAETLKASPTTTKMMPMISPMETFEASSVWASVSKLVLPAKP